MMRPAAFSRNIGILTAAEQQKLFRSTVAIAGLGGVGGNVAILLARIGVGSFELADFDRFEEVDVNRQYGSSTAALGQLKVEVLAREVRAINPDADVSVFGQGFTPENADEVLKGSAIVVDAVDFYAIDAHLAVHTAARRHGLYTVMGSAVGFSACLQVFDPNGMNIEEYCDIREDMLPLEKQLQLRLSIVPELLHINYFDVSRGDLQHRFHEKYRPVRFGGLRARSVPRSHRGGAHPAQAEEAALYPIHVPVRSLHLALCSDLYRRGHAQL